MASGNDDETKGGAPASSPCMLHELGPDGRPQVDPEQARDVARWRKVERERLLGVRSALTEAYRDEQTRALVQSIEQILATMSIRALGVYWPSRSEPDLRPWMDACSKRGVRLALPVATALGQPLSYREWHPNARLARGLWNIPFPADGAETLPNIVIAPLVGFDSACYRLGYGGGFFDRTLAALSPRPLAIGVGYPCASLPTIYPQPHDVPMDWILSGASMPLRRMTG